jgi:HK97 family phage major capsid protein
MNFKELIEKRNELVETMDGIFANAETEKRALNEDENTKYDEIMSEIRSIDNTLKKAEEARSIDNVTAKETKADDTEERAFVEYIRSEKRSLAAGDNGAIIPQTIADRIIEQVKNIAPIYELATKYTAKGNLIFPVYDESENSVTTAYATEFTALNSKSGKFTSIKLGGHLAGALTKVSKSLINSAEFDLLSYVVNKMSESIARFLEHELLVGEGGDDKMTGVLVDSNTPVVDAAAASAISADDLVKVQVEVPQVYQNNAVWIMSKKTLLAIRTLKDGENRYMLQEDMTAPFGYSLLGRPVYVSDNMPEIGTKNKAVVYGDMSGIFCNVRPNVEIQVLAERYADEHAVGVVAWIEADSKVAEKQKIAVLKMA